MRTIAVTLLLSVLFAGSPVHGQDTQQTDYVPGVVLVKFEKQALPNVTQTLRSQTVSGPQVVAALDSVGFEGGKKLFEDFMPSDTMATTHSGEKTQLVNLSRWYKITVSSSANIPRLAEHLEELPGIESASPDHILSTRSTTPNDPKFEQGNQWGLSNSTNPDADIHAPSAWDKNKGRSDVVVGVIDTGIDYNHHDLDPGDRSRVIQGHDFGNDDSDAMDIVGHGTGVAGAIGAITNNDRDVAGVMWNLQLMPLKASDQLEGITASLAAEALNHARNNGVDIVNMSFSRGPCEFPNLFCTESPLAGPVRNAYLQGLTLSASTGNNGQKEVQYPAGNWGIMAVGASDKDDTRDNTSTYGPHVDFVAPSEFQSTDLNNGTQQFGGTSHAAAIASGVAGLILSESRDRGLGLTNDDIRHLMQRTADDIEEPGQDDETGHGRLNANAALEALQAPNEVVHATKTGGSSQKIFSDKKRTFFSSGLPKDLASGKYFVDMYEVTGHVTFSTPFKNPPMVWIRDRETVGWSDNNPNSEFPYVEITNVTKEGFDYKTFVYYVEDLLGRDVGWKPVGPSYVEVAYTAVGEPGAPPLDVSITSGPTVLDEGEQGTWTASASKSGVSYTWSADVGYGWTQIGTGSSVTWGKDYISSTITADIKVEASKDGETATALTSVIIYDECNAPGGNRICAAVDGNSFLLRDVRAEAQKNGIASVRWQASGSEVPSEFVVQHRADSTAAWSTLGTVPASDSSDVNSSRTAAYRFRTDKLEIGTHQFRVGLPQDADPGPRAVGTNGEDNLQRFAGPVTAEVEMDEAYRLSTYPNPAREQATVELAVQERQEVSVHLYDVLGRRVATLHSGPMPAQELRRLQLDVSSTGLTSGTYFLRVRGEDFATTERITVVR